MCKVLLVSLRVRAEPLDDGTPYPGVPEPTEVDAHLGDDGQPCCLCCLADDGADGESARAAVMAALKPFLAHISIGNILIEVI